MQLHANDEFSDMELEKQDYTMQSLARIRLSSTICTKVQFANTDMSDSVMNMAKFIGCNLTGTQFIKANITDTVFSDCKIALGSFMFANLKNVLFDNCTFTEVDFREATFEQVVYKKCTLEAVDFSSATVKNSLDISSSQLISLSGILKLKGLVIGNEQILQLAPYMASELGYIIKID